MVPLRIASVPAAHPYVEHLGTDGVVRLPDPRPAGAPPGRWWPPVMLDATWVRLHAATFDVLHLHFGAESATPRDLQALLRALRTAGRPLVHTVHDLSHPQLHDQARHHEQLDVLVPGADALVTLTAGAAAEVRRRWGTEAEVVPHPHVHPLDVEPPLGSPGRAPVLGLHLRDLRPNVDGPGATRQLVAAAQRLREEGRPVEVRVVLHERVRDEPARDEVRAACAGRPWVELREGPRPGDAALARSLADLDVSILPYAHGTHSGWLELCWDLGVSVAAPRLGHLLEQHVEPASVAGFVRHEAGSLAHALRRLLDAEGHAAPGSAERHRRVVLRRARRRLQAPEIARAHLELYARATGRVPAVSAA